MSKAMDDALLRACAIVLLVLFASGGISSTVSAQTQPVTAVGNTAGRYSVSATGQATYSIPLWTPPGVNGVEPNLSLVYSSSRSPGGLISPGWSLSGLSQIARCQRTWDQDGFAAPVYLTTADAFCMDGKRLRVTSGTATYGQPNSTYLAEITDFSLVKAIGTAGNGPAWFEVKLKNGLIYEYGNSADSRATLSGGDTPYAWALSKIRDRQGNNLTIGYAQSSGTLAPMTIDYAQIPSIGATYPYTVTFTYATRDLNDRTAGYIAGTQFSVDSQITAIDVKHGGVNGTEEALYADLIHAA